MLKRKRRFLLTLSRRCLVISSRIGNELIRNVWQLLECGNYYITNEREEMITESEILLYTTRDGDIKVDVIYSDESIWITRKKMETLFGVQKAAISKHLRNIFEAKELKKELVVTKMKTTGANGYNYETQYYNLDAIIAVGYRVNSRQATDFRIWASRVLKEFIIKGFIVDSERLKNGSKFGKDYFDDLIEIVKEIRTSERRFYQKITDIFAECSADYDPNSEITKNFYAQVQNKLHWAIHGATAAEVVSSRVDHKKQHMGLTTWKKAPHGKILKSDVSVAKNYLSEKEVKELNHIVSMYLDYAELQASKKRVMNMQDWASKLDAFLSFNDYEILEHTGKVSAKVARALADSEFEKYKVIQDQLHSSDFDNLVNVSKSVFETEL